MSSAGRGRLSQHVGSGIRRCRRFRYRYFKRFPGAKGENQIAIIELSYNYNFLKRLLENPGAFWRCIREFLRFVPNVGLKNP